MKNTYVYNVYLEMVISNVTSYGCHFVIENC